MANNYILILEVFMLKILDFASENHCYISCPFCRTEMDYGKISANLSRNETDTVPCLNCGKMLNLISIGYGLEIDS